MERSSCDYELRINTLSADCEAWRARFEEAVRDRANDAASRRDLERQLQDARVTSERTSDDLTTATSRLGAFEERAGGLEREAAALRMAISAADAATAAARVDADRAVARVRAEMAAERQADIERVETRLSETAASLRTLEREHAQLQAAERTATDRWQRSNEDAAALRGELTQSRSLAEQAALRSTVSLREREMEVADLNSRLQASQRELQQQRDHAAEQLAAAVAAHRRRERELADEKASFQQRLRDLEEDSQRLRQRLAMVGGKTMSLMTEVEASVLGALRRSFQDGSTSLAAMFSADGGDYDAAGGTSAGGTTRGGTGHPLVPPLETSYMRRGGGMTNRSRTPSG